MITVMELANTTITATTIGSAATATIETTHSVTKSTTTTAAELSALAAPAITQTY